MPKRTHVESPAISLMALNAPNSQAIPAQLPESSHHNGYTLDPLPEIQPGSPSNSRYRLARVLIKSRFVQLFVAFSTFVLICCSSSSTKRVDTPFPWYFASTLLASSGRPWAYSLAWSVQLCTGVVYWADLPSWGFRQEEDRARHDHTD